MIILTEKPNISRYFANAYDCKFHDGFYSNSDNSIVITNCVGHLLELSEPSQYGERFKDWHNLPVIPADFSYEAKPETANQLKIVLSLLNKYKNDLLLIATDADREGELIARECLNNTGTLFNFNKIKRFWVSQALTPDVISAGVNEAKPLSDYDYLAKQAYSRQHADWLVGMNFTRYLSVAAGTTLPVGRVQTAILSAIYSRCKEIESFKTEKYFEHYATFKTPRGVLSCKGIYFDENDKTAFADNSKEPILLNSVGNRAMLVSSKNEDKQLNPPLLFDLNDCQKAAFKYFEYSAKKTLDIIQSLYEDLMCVSYPRTPSKVMGSQNVELCKNIFTSLITAYPKYKPLETVSDISLNNKRVFNDSQLEAHHALIPLKAIPENASAEQKNIYLLILERFLLAFSPAHKYKVSTYILNVDGNNFRVTGKSVQESGWKENLGLFRLNKPGEQDNEDGQTLDNINLNELVLEEIETKEKWTKPPKYFNEASILSFMQNPKQKRHVAFQEDENQKLLEIGTEATRHTYVPKLLQYGYIKTDRKNLLCTELGAKLIEAVNNSSISQIADISQTTLWENELSVNPDSFMTEMKKFVGSAVTKPLSLNNFLPKSNLQCPLCGKDVRKGRTGWYCTGYKEGCKFSVWENTCGTKMNEKDVVSLCSGKLTGIKHCTSKAGKKFDCKFKYNRELNKLDFVFENKQK